MLQKLSNKSVRGPYFTVSVPNIDKVEYVEAGKVATVEIEGGLGESVVGKPAQVDWLVYASTLGGWLPPHEFEEMDANKRKEILDNVSDALSMLEMPHKMVA